MTSRTNGFDRKITKKTRMTSKTKGFDKKTPKKDQNDK